ncbi:MULTISPECIES: excinuclease ABC subunit UvrC [unclassified Bosea (in: a-proteobacteria)]|uniref:excinuclease ABC subunit UvrC n=1 Tax=unclassified Bosea (in: a-proteobacteria) TaxID=2653178 RepID=UPI000F7518C1|nr:MULTISPECIES: excinuclease ABC subunit UvrC [unclassified Bosea (in: a-proteobacteria)]AZO81130.1 excinuclease ABC subunit C [Bosea sp. Tri-49]RXT26523.1 excinuclease ABC subunit C [Bosea sp. Tri-39]RXT33124.1 excinuclease ABC subunit C [Bosea sp. Tri-54]
MNRERQEPPEQELPDEDFKDEEDILPPPEAALDPGEAAPGALKAGIEVIADFAKHLPNRPGVYRMFDRAGEVLYVGKAKSLKNRVTAYARGMAHTNAVARMIAETANMEFVTTGTETEALLLESNLIKQLRPRYNVLLRDDKSFPYIFLSGDHPAPQIAKHRGSRQRKGDYFGPFASVWAVERTIDALQKAFLLRSCSDSYYENRTRPCLLFQIKRCSGPCTGEISLSDYQGLADQARDFLSGRSSAVKELLSKRMQAAAEELEFEKAARYRDRLAALSAVQAGQDINTQGVEEADVFAIDEQAGQFCVEIFFFRNKQNWGNRALFPRADKSLTPAEVLAYVVTQFYDDKPPPRLVLLSHELAEADLIAQALCERAGRKVELATPKRGERRDLVAHAQKNAHEALARKLADNAGQQSLLAALGEAFGMAKAPRRVEVYDNSHIMGTNAVGGMVVAGRDGFMKSHYRTFNISSDTIAGDDFGMMREVLKRRFARLAKESGTTAEAAELTQADTTGQPDAVVDEVGGSSPSPATIPPEELAGPAPELPDGDAFPSRPDLVIVDGGKGQFEAARKIMAECGVTDIALVAIAKGEDRNAMRETFFMVGKEPFKLPPRDPALFFIQRLRDEAHRFAIGTHRAKRKRDIKTNPLDEIPGIGPSRKRALLLHFGTVKAIQRAKLDDLMRTPGVNAATAKAVHAHFHEH